MRQTGRMRNYELDDVAICKLCIYSIQPMAVLA